MKLAIQYAFPNYALVAETELIQRFAIAVRNLGWQAVEVVTSDDILRFCPDWVLATHYSSPKLTQFPTLGMMTNPTEYFRDSPEHVQNIRSYDGYLSGSPRITEYLNDFLFPTGKKVPITDFPFLVSTHKTEFIERPPGPCRLFYVGTRWDAGSRHGALFERLSKVVPLDVYGPARNWAGVDCTYRGEIRPDGRSLLVKLRESGAALCIHSKEHRAWQLPTMRIFEAAAAGAAILADDIPFIYENFGDAILPIDTHGPIDQVVQQVSEHLAWINHHPRQAMEMARQAHAIFCEKFCLERLFERLPAFLDLVRQVGGYNEALRSSAGLITGWIEKSNGRGEAALAKHYLRLPTESSSSSVGVITERSTTFDCDAGRDREDQCGLNAQINGPQLEYIICVGDAPVNQVDRCLRSLEEQSYKDLGVIVVRSTDGDGLDEILVKHRPDFASMKVLSAEPTKVRSNTLWTGLRAVTAPFFATLPPDHYLQPNHVASLMEAFGENQQVTVAQASCLEVRSDDGPYFEQWNFQGPLGQMIPETRRLASLGPVAPDKLIDSPDNISACSWIARRELLNNAVMQDPNLPAAADVYLCALLLTRGRVVHTWRPTCEWHIGARAASSPDVNGTICMERIRCRLGLGRTPDVGQMLHNFEERLKGVHQECVRNIQNLQQQFGQQVQSLHQELFGRVQICQQELVGQIQNCRQELVGQIQNCRQELAGQLHHVTPPESHALHRLSQGYLALRGAGKVLARPRLLPGRCWRGLGILAWQGPRRFLGRLSQIGQRPN
jgi:hypothetical protein